MTSSLSWWSTRRRVLRPAAQTASEALPRKESRRAVQISSPLCTFFLHSSHRRLSTARSLAKRATFPPGRVTLHLFVSHRRGRSVVGVRLHAVARQRPPGGTAKRRAYFEKRFSGSVNSSQPRG